MGDSNPLTYTDFLQEKDEEVLVLGASNTQEVLGKNHNLNENLHISQW